MKWLYIVVPSLLTVSFVAYTSWYAKADRQVVFSGDSPLIWPRPKVQVGPAVQVSVRESYVGRDAEAEAREAIRTGQVVYFQFGESPPWYEEFAEIWGRRFGVKVETVVEPLVLDSQTEYFATYNRIVEKYLVDRFGANAYWDAAREAKRLFEKRPSRKG